MTFEGFKQYNKKPNTITSGTLFTKTIKISFAREQKRTLFVWLPEDYNGKKRFPVFYFCDGQNMVDKYLTAYGEWELDEKIHEFIQNGHQGIILVGIACCDNGDNREAEYRPNIAERKTRFKRDKYSNDYAEEFANYLVNDIKPLVDSIFLTKKDKEHTGFGGSSMGGLFSFFIAQKYPNIFSMALSFSPAFLFYKRKSLRMYFETIKNSDVKVVLYSGKKGRLEKRICHDTIWTFKALLKVGYDNDKILLLNDKKQTHNEKAWSQYLIPSFLFLLK